MKILNFFPLLVWMVSIAFLITLEAHWQKPGAAIQPEAADNSGVKVWLLGTIFWAMIALILSLV